MGAKNTTTVIPIPIPKSKPREPRSKTRARNTLHVQPNTPSLWVRRGRRHDRTGYWEVQKRLSSDKAYLADAKDVMGKEGRRERGAGGRAQMLPISATKSSSSFFVSLYFLTISSYLVSSWAFDCSRAWTLRSKCPAFTSVWRSLLGCCQRTILLQPYRPSTRRRGGGGHTSRWSP